MNTQHDDARFSLFFPWFFLMMLPISISYILLYLSWVLIKTLFKKKKGILASRGGKRAQKTPNTTKSWGAE